MSLVPTHRDSVQCTLYLINGFYAWYVSTKVIRILIRVDSYHAAVYLQERYCEM